MRAKRLTWKGETTHQEGRIDPGRIGSKGETTRGEGVKRAKRPDAYDNHLNQITDWYSFDLRISIKNPFY